ncbi:hypothetical protein [Streptomyces sp. NPDC101455]|uniref:hypothetical protein n=1 Tax=Streptomyces sp. NPDC101455 TaxID=3366142 RepID=UPI0038267564
MDAGKAAGSIRADVDAHGVLLLIAYLSRPDREEWGSRARPLMNVVLDGGGPPGCRGCRTGAGSRTAGGFA